MMTRIADIIFKVKNKFQLAFADFKTYHKAIIIKALYYWEVGMEIEIKKTNSLHCC